VGDCRSVVESDFYTKLKKLDVQGQKVAKLFADHVTQVCEVHNQVIVPFLQQVQGFARPTTEGSREKIGHNVIAVLLPAVGIEPTSRYQRTFLRRKPLGTNSPGG